jgi:flavorubredoxin/flavin reductase (DIM6/NTAB) family NADH-FMN oxidoreductase RutF
MKSLVLSPPSSPSTRLTMQTAELAPETMVLRCLDWDRDRFDIEFALDNGTTYNSFLIRGEKTALIDTSHEKFRQLYLDELNRSVDLQSIDYLIVSHTEPDHSGLVGDLLELAPQITVVGAKVAIQFLEQQVNCTFSSRIVKNGDRLDLGNDHVLEFVSAPNLHWPDTIFTYDEKTRILYTCDAFGMHYCDDHLFDEMPQMLQQDFQYYYDCLMGPNARSVLSALKRVEKFDIDSIATGHGPLLKYHLSQWVNDYRLWSEAQAKTTSYVAVFYAEDYGFSEQLAHTVGQGITKTELPAEYLDLSSAELSDIRELAQAAAGIVVGMPAQSDGIAQAALATLLASVHKKQSIGLFESGGGQDEPVYPLRNKFREVGLTEAFPPILVKEAPTSTLNHLCEEAGTDLGQWLCRDRTVQQIKSIDSELEKALGRISGGLYIITASKDGATSAMLASWVMQASGDPLGVAIAVAKDRAIESFLHGGDRFVLNVLGEDNYQGITRHFLKRFPPGADRFEGVKTYPATCGTPILADALAYAECEVVSRLECSDHWIVYSNVQTGRVSKPDTLTAVHHRKVGNHY